PPELIFEDDVRRKYQVLSFEELLERRNSVTVTFPDVGLGPLFRLVLEALDVRDNARDFGLTKGAGFARLIYRPERQLWTQLGTSVERNSAHIFGAEGKDALAEDVRRNPCVRADPGSRLCPPDLPARAAAVDAARYLGGAELGAHLRCGGQGCSRRVRAQQPALRQRRARSGGHVDGLFAERQPDLGSQKP